MHFVETLVVLLNLRVRLRLRECVPCLPKSQEGVTLLESGVRSILRRSASLQVLSITALRPKACAKTSLPCCSGCIADGRSPEACSLPSPDFQHSPPSSLSHRRKRKRSQTWILLELPPCTCLLKDAVVRYTLCWYFEGASRSHDGSCVLSCQNGQAGQHTETGVHISIQDTGDGRDLAQQAQQTPRPAR